MEIHRYCKEVNRPPFFIVDILIDNRNVQRLQWSHSAAPRSFTLILCIIDVISMIIEVIDEKKMENGKIMVNLWNGALWGSRVYFIVTQLKFSDPSTPSPAPSPLGNSLWPVPKARDWNMNTLQQLLHVVFQKHYHYIMLFNNRRNLLEKNCFQAYGGPWNPSGTRCGRWNIVIVNFMNIWRKSKNAKLCTYVHVWWVSCIRDMIMTFKHISLFEHYYALSKNWNVSIPLRFTGADLLCPSVLFASHQYCPWSWGCTDSKFNIE